MSDKMFDHINRSVIAEQVLDALFGAEEIVETLYRRGTIGLLREVSAGRVADVLTKLKVAKATFASPPADWHTTELPIPVQIADLQARIDELRALEEKRIDAACRETLDRAWAAAAATSNPCECACEACFLGLHCDRASCAT